MGKFERWKSMIYSHSKFLAKTCPESRGNRKILLVSN